MQNLGRPTGRRQVVPDASGFGPWDVDLELPGLVPYEQGICVHLVHPHACLLEGATHMGEPGLKPAAVGHDGTVAFGGSGGRREVADERGPGDGCRSGVGTRGKRHRLVGGGTASASGRHGEQGDAEEPL
jgi:hypothetical protein